MIFPIQPKVSVNIWEHMNSADEQVTINTIIQSQQMKRISQLNPTQGKSEH